MDTPEPEYVGKLRLLNERMDGLSTRLQAVHLELPGGKVETAISAEFTALAGIPGCETRLVPGAFLMETRYTGLTVCAEVAVPQAVYVCVQAGRFQLRRLDTEAALTTYLPGQVVHLQPGERHGWLAQADTRNLIAFVPADTSDAA